MNLGHLSPSDLVIVGNVSDDPFAIDVAHSLGQLDDIDDLISMKTFANSEFCPRFISDEDDLTRIGSKLADKIVVIVSTSNAVVSRQNLSMRNMMIARSAKENGAAAVVLVEPDLFYSAQDRGPHRYLGVTLDERSQQDLKKFDGQPFTARLYAEMLKLAGVDQVVTVHNHSHSVQQTFRDVFAGEFHDLIPYDVYSDYLVNSDIVGAGGSIAADGDGLVLCAPDQGARKFVQGMFEALALPRAKVIQLDKDRSGERRVDISLHANSEATLDDIAGREVVLFDDMVRTGSTVVKSCQFLKQVEIGKMVFAVTHFYASDEGRQKMASTAIDEILTMNTLPTVQNRDVQGRLRRKMVVLRIERWLARNLGEILGVPTRPDDGWYQIDMSSKNPRFKRKITSSDQLRDLHS